LSGYVTGRRWRVHPFQVGPQSQSVQDFYEESERLRRLVNSSSLRGGMIEGTERPIRPRQGRREHGEDISQADLDRYHTLQFTGEIMAAIRRSSIELPREQRNQHVHWMVGLARSAMGQQASPTHPNPLRAETWDTLPDPVRETIRNSLAIQLQHANAPAPAYQRGETQEHYDRRLDEWREEARQATLILNLAGLNRQQAQELLLRRAQQQNLNRLMTPAEVARLGPNPRARLTPGQIRAATR
jgi:hypothetical protein